MAFVLAPLSSPHCSAQPCNPFGLYGPVSRSPYTYHIARSRPQVSRRSPFNNFFRQIDQLMSELDRETQHEEQLRTIDAQHKAQRQARSQRQRLGRAIGANFAINQTEQGWRIDGQIPEFNQQNISIEVTDKHTLKVSGNTRWKSEKNAQLGAVVEPSLVQQPAEKATENEVDVVEPTKVQAETQESDTQSHRSYQATVADDFEDLGAETSSLISFPSRPSSPTRATESRDKKEPIEESAVSAQPAPEASSQQPQQSEREREERVHRCFERTFRFPQRINAADVSARFKDGTLHITVPRAQAQDVRRIVIL